MQCTSSSCFVSFCTLLFQEWIASAPRRGVTERECRCLCSSAGGKFSNIENSIDSDRIEESGISLQILPLHAIHFFVFLSWFSEYMFQMNVFKYQRLKLACEPYFPFSQYSFLSLGIRQTIFSFDTEKWKHSPVPCPSFCACPASIFSPSITQTREIWYFPCQDDASFVTVVVRV